VRAIQGLAPSPTGLKLMAANFAGGSYQAYRSLNGGTDWEIMTGLVPLGMSVYENCGDDFRFIFGGGTNLKYTQNLASNNAEDFYNKEMTATIDIGFNHMCLCYSHTKEFFDIYAFEIDVDSRIATLCDKLDEICQNIDVKNVIVE
jgi:hypothetical protein